MNVTAPTNLLADLSHAEMQMIQAFRRMDGDYARMWLHTGLSLSAKHPKEEPMRLKVIQGGKA